MKKLFLLLSIITFVSCSSDDDNTKSGKSEIVGKWQTTERKGNLESDVWETYKNIIEEFTSDGRCIVTESDGYTTTTTYSISGSNILIYYSSNKDKTKPNETWQISKQTDNELEYVTYYGDERLNSYRLKRIN